MRSNYELKQRMERQLDRVKAKIRRIVITNQDLPHDRLSKGREIRDLLILGIKQIDEVDEEGLTKTIRELEELRIL